MHLQPFYEHYEFFSDNSDAIAGIGRCVRPGRLSAQRYENDGKGYGPGLRDHKGLF